MKKILLTAFALVCITAISFAQQAKPASSQKIKSLSKKSDSEIIAAKKLSAKKKAEAFKASQILSASGARKEADLNQ